MVGRRSFPFGLRLQADERYFERHGEPLFLSAPGAVNQKSEEETGYL